MKYSQRTVFIPDIIDIIIKETAKTEKRSYTRQLETILESFFRDDERYTNSRNSDNLYTNTLDSNNQS